MAITTRSGKILNDSISAGNEQEQSIGMNEEEEVEVEQVDDIEEDKSTVRPTKILRFPYFGRPFLAISRALVDVESGELNFSLNNEEVKFKICRSMNKPQDMNVVYAIEVFDERELKAAIEERFVVETLAAVLMNFEEDFWDDYVETLNSLQGMGSHSYAPKKLDLDMKNKPNLRQSHLLKSRLYLN
ncbi:hypothetical protein R3W88_004280 [Solanum pinnatisectum]|uniref:Uncharacterized protein n=1 Tax=Solanum pinnatisectum TaxID=50273 RepID=A0AAV9KCG4_9SOLN|nr:hypothetical protein R3W88_004280 [Solanum pinnatisectum]